MGRWIPVAAADALVPGEAMSARAGDRSVAVVNVAGRLFALEDICPHMGAPLGSGVVDGACLVCPWHAWRFDPATGNAVFQKRVTVPTYPVRVQDGRIEVEIPERA